MKRILLFTAGGTAVFVAGAITGTVIVGRMVLPVVDTNKVVNKITDGMEKTQVVVMNKVFGVIPAESKYSVYSSIRRDQLAKGEGI
jgi:hypothetical protein